LIIGLFLPSSFLPPSLPSFLFQCWGSNLGLHRVYANALSLTYAWFLSGILTFSFTVIAKRKIKQ
jgi:hypothetical protein